MYNKEIKNRFLENYNEETAKTYRDSLMQINEAEVFYNDDVFNFSYEQLDDAFSGIRAKSVAGVRRVITPVLEYIRWANQNGFVKSKIDITSLFSGEKLKDYVWKHAQDSSYIYREEMYGLCERLVNDIDKAILVLAFEGIDGKNHFEMINLKYSDIDFGTGTLQVTNIDGEIREVTITHQESLDILKDSEQQTTYLLGNGYAPNAKKKDYELVDSPYVIRKIARSINAIDDSETVSMGFLLAKVTRMFKGKKDPVSGNYTEEPFLSDCEFLNLTGLFKSGYFDYCMELERERGELGIKDYQEACVRYGLNINLAQSYKTQYLDWKTNNNVVI